MFKKPMIFFGNCGCGGGSPQSALPPVNGGAAVCDPRYLALASVPRLKLLGVTPGAQCQQFLGSTLPGNFFLMLGPDGQTFPTDQPQISLPDFNPAVSGAYPQPGGFSKIVIANGSNPALWYFLEAPSSGSKVLTSVNGQWLLQDPAGQTGQTAVCSQGTTTAKGNLISCVDTGTVDSLGAPVYALRKLAVRHTGIVVGDVDPITSASGFKTILLTEYLLHPKAKLDDLQCITFKHYTDPVTLATEAGGIMVQPVAPGPTQITDAEIVTYSPTTMRFYRSPARTKQTLTVDADVIVADNSTYVSMGGHCQFSGVQFNYPDFFIFADIRLRAAGVGGSPAASYNNVLFGLFIDGVQVHTWDVKGDSVIALSHLYKGLTIGVHTVEIRFFQTTDPNSQMTIKNSNSDLFTAF